VEAVGPLHTRSAGVALTSWGVRGKAPVGSGLAGGASRAVATLPATIGSGRRQAWGARGSPSGRSWCASAAQDFAAWPGLACPGSQPSARQREPPGEPVLDRSLNQRLLSGALSGEHRRFRRRHRPPYSTRALRPSPPPAPCPQTRATGGLQGGRKRSRPAALHRGAGWTRLTPGDGSPKGV
jgi:hypothetical protein